MSDRMSNANSMLRKFPNVLVAALAAFLGADSVTQAQQRALGIDVSAWQGNLSQTTWNNLRNVDDRDFVFIRSSRGGTTGYYNQNNSDNNPPTNTLSQRYDDPYFVQNITRATAAGMLAGTYHFSRPDVIASTLNANGIPNNGTDEANHFLQMAGPWMRPGFLLPVHDLEAGDGARTDNEMAQFSIDFSNRIYDVMGIRPAIYLNGNYAHNILGGASSTLRNQLLATHPTLWSARWPAGSGNPYQGDIQTEQPKDTYAPIYGPWDDDGTAHPWAFWQYSSGERLQSFGARLDGDVANGGIEFVKDHLVPAIWMNDSSGSWSTLANWNSGQTPVAPVQGPGQVARVGALTLPAVRLPGAAGTGVNDTVILERANADITVTLASGNHNIRKLYAREALDITGGSLNINYTPSADSTPISAQFSAPVSLSGSASLSVHTLQVDATRTFTLGGGTLTFNTINLMPHGATPAKIAINGDVNISPLAGATATIATGAGNSGIVDLGGADRALNVANGAAAVDLSVNVPVTNGALTKSGAGALALTGVNTYAGDTTIEAGKLSVSNAFLADGADVYLSAGAILDLNFNGNPDVIDSLFIDGVSQAAGTWGALGSGADHTSDLLAGMGLLQITTFVPPFLGGDYNEDGTVDAADYGVWRDNLGSPTSLPNDDTDGVGEDDYLRWKANFGNSLPANGAGAANGAAVPEPASGALLAAGFVFLAILRRTAQL